MSIVGKIADFVGHDSYDHLFAIIDLFDEHRDIQAGIAWLFSTNSHLNGNTPVVELHHAHTDDQRDAVVRAAQWYLEL